MVTPSANLVDLWGGGGSIYAYGLYTAIYACIHMYTYMYMYTWTHMQIREMAS